MFLVILSIRPEVYTLSDCDLLSTDRLSKVHREIPADMPGVANLSGGGVVGGGGPAADTISSILELAVSGDRESPRDFWKAFQ